MMFLFWHSIAEIVTPEKEFIVIQAHKNCKLQYNLNFELSQ